jgi:hypothetical protein
MGEQNGMPLPKYLGYVVFQNMEEMKSQFENWLKENKETITRPDKYSSTIITISNHLKSKNLTDTDIYSKTDGDEVVKIQQRYFSFDEFYNRNIKGKRMYSRSLDLYIEFLDSYKGIPTKIIAPEIESVVINPMLTNTEKQSIILSRRGQGQYRENLVKLWGKCSITGYDDVRLLVASHIKPWNKSDNSERIDKFNGLLLLPTYDKLFDLGFIGFNGKGNIYISKELISPEVLHVDPKTRIQTHRNHHLYLEYHLEHVFRN